MNNTGKDIYGLLGKGISYSLSPVMHNAAFSHYGIDAEYKIFDIEENMVEQFFNETLLGGKVEGLNVTVPYKIKIKEFLEENNSCRLDDIASVLGTVNTVRIDENGLTGCNTDGEGFYNSLLEETGYKDLSGKNIFVLGAGGASRAICFYLALSVPSVKDISVYDINTESLNSLRSGFEKSFDGKKLFAVEESELEDRIRESDILINATPLGTKPGGPLPVSADLLKNDMVVYDLVYCRETELVISAREKGARAFNGLGMLINQGAKAFNLWTQKPVEKTRAIMKNALAEVMEKSG